MPICSKTASHVQPAVQINNEFLSVDGHLQRVCTATFFSGVTKRGHGHRVSATSISRNTEYKKPETLLVELTAGKKIYHQGRKHKDVFDISSPLYSHTQHAPVGHATWWVCLIWVTQHAGRCLKSGIH